MAFQLQNWKLPGMSLSYKPQFDVDPVQAATPLATTAPVTPVTPPVTPVTPTVQPPVLPPKPYLKPPTPAGPGLGTTLTGRPDPQMDALHVASVTGAIPGADIYQQWLRDTGGKSVNPGPPNPIDDARYVADRNYVPDRTGTGNRVGSGPQSRADDMRHILDPNYVARGVTSNAGGKRIVQGILQTAPVTGQLGGKPALKSDIKPLKTTTTNRVPVKRPVKRVKR